MGDFIKKYSDLSDPIDTPGVLGTSTIFDGVLGYTTADEHAGVAGACDEGNGNGVYGRSANRNGIYGHSSAKFHSGVAGINDNETNEAGPGVYGKSKGAGVFGESDTWHAVAGISKSTTGGAGVYGKGKVAALFEGDVIIREGGKLLIRIADEYINFSELHYHVKNLRSGNKIAFGRIDMCDSSIKYLNEQIESLQKKVDQLLNGK